MTNIEMEDNVVKLEWIAHKNMVENKKQVRKELLLEIFKQHFGNICENDVDIYICPK